MYFLDDLDEEDYEIAIKVSLLSEKFIGNRLSDRKKGMSVMIANVFNSKFNRWSHKDQFSFFVPLLRNRRER